MINRITQFHEHDGLVSVAQGALGKTGLWLAGLVLLSWHETSLLMLAAFSLVMLFPVRRRALLSLAALGVIAEGFLQWQGIGPTLDNVGREALVGIKWPNLIVGTSIAVSGLYVVFLVATRFDRLPAIVRQYPLVTLHGAVWAGLLLSPLPWLGVLAKSPYLAWRISYLLTLASRGKAVGTRFQDHLFYLMPVWSGTTTPYGKGLDYLSRHEAYDPEPFARSQLAGIKLLLLAILWLWARDWLDAFFFGNDSGRFTAFLGGWTMDLPRLAGLLRAETIFTTPTAWAVIYLELVRATLSLAVTGHVIIGCLRLLGFNVYRNTYKPLLSESIVEFWNRYYFYFKELLVEFFFYPTYLRCTKAGPRLRLFLAVFAAAFVGNMYYHLLAHHGPVVDGDPGLLWATWGPRLVYCFLLTLGIWVSMLRQQKKRATETTIGVLVRLRRIAGVLTFYALIQVWNVRSTELGFTERLDFIASLLGF